MGGVFNGVDRGWILRIGLVQGQMPVYGIRHPEYNGAVM